ncbi:hypothetical protein EDC18_101428 [Natranaerovirga pectinivora]|uniref:Uncharacterized protein n=1 Tax=Natranaerovirga pectinivora TaxID=682400 RepID=A0A4R3MTT4_9FIRM|nr:hypothetical protein [Natranaerovirga pectinivora]TCT17130.1 hypothetical protein EDC18_101428 [Natranaerovirga pectinivora]
MEKFLAIIGALMPILTIVVTRLIKEKFGDKMYSNYSPYNNYKGNPLLNTLN